MFSYLISLQFLFSRVSDLQSETCHLVKWACWFHRHDCHHAQCRNSQLGHKINAKLRDHSVELGLSANIIFPPLALGVVGRYGVNIHIQLTSAQAFSVRISLAARPYRIESETESKEDGCSWYGCLSC